MHQQDVYAPPPAATARRRYEQHPTLTADEVVLDFTRGEYGRYSSLEYDIERAFGDEEPQNS